MQLQLAEAAWLAGERRHPQTPTESKAYQSTATLHSCGTLAKCMSVKALVNRCVRVSVLVKSNGTVYSSPFARTSVVTGWMMQAVPQPNISSKRPPCDAWSNANNHCASLSRLCILGNCKREKTFPHDTISCGSQSMCLWTSHAMFHHLQHISRKP